MASLTKRERSIASKFRRYEKAQAKAKTFYTRADTLLAQIALLMSANNRKPVAITSRTGVVSYHYVARIRESGQELHCTDRAAGDALVLGWGHGAVRRYELETLNP